MTAPALLPDTIYPPRQASSVQLGVYGGYADGCQSQSAPALRQQPGAWPNLTRRLDMTHPTPPQQRFWAKVNRHGMLRSPYLGPCWSWTGALFKTGYGAMHLGGPNGVVYAHRFSYELLVGPIPEGLQLDHLCRNRACVNPVHLEAITRRENILRGNGASAKHARTTHCPQGHSYDELNTYRDGKGRRYCRACNRKAKRTAARKAHGSRP